MDINISLRGQYNRKSGFVGKDKLRYLADRAKMICCTDWMCKQTAKISISVISIETLSIFTVCFFLNSSSREHYKISTLIPPLLHSKPCIGVK